MEGSVKSGGQFFSRNWHWIIFSFMLVSVYWHSRAGELLNFNPLGEHNWANCDRASVAYNYYQNGSSFFEPQTQNVVDNPSGIAHGEFPLMPWLASLLYRILGFDEFWFRLLTLLFSLAGFYFAFALCNRLIRDKILVLAASALWPCSTYLIYYSTGFLPDNVSLTFLIIAFYFAMKNYPEISFRSVCWFAFFSALAILLKTSAFFLFAPASLAVLVLVWKNQKKTKAVLIHAGVLILPVIFMGSWILYAKHMQEKYHSAIFLLKGKTPESTEQYKALLGDFFDRSGNYYNDALLIAAAICLAGLFILRKHLAAAIHLVWVLGLCAWFVFFWMLARNAWHHSYYHIPFFFIFFVFSLGFFLALDKISLSKNIRSGILLAVFCLFLFSVSDMKTKLNPVAFQLQLEKPDWYGAGDALKKMGVPDDAILFSCEDPSPNISLYLMKHRGWTGLNHFWASYMTKAISNCDYAVLTDTTLVHQKEYAPYFEKQTGRFNSLFIYKIRKDVPDNRPPIGPGEKE